MKGEFRRMKNIKLKQMLKKYKKVGSITGRLGDQILKYEKNKDEFVYLKIGTGISLESLRRESYVLDWLKGSGLNTPKVLYYTEKDGVAYLLISGIKGLSIYKFKNVCKKKLLKITAEALRKFHALPIKGPSKLNTLKKDILEIEKYLKYDAIKTKQFIESNDGKTPQNVFNYLKANMDIFNVDVINHGDFCLANILLDENFDYGYIDLGECGPGDKYKDLSSLEVSIKRNFGEDWIKTFYNYYDSNLNVDQFKIRYFQLIDQFDYHLDKHRYLKALKLN